MSKSMEAIMATRFAPFNFSVCSDFPNDVPTMDEWGYFLPRLIGDDHDHPAQHLIEFHQYMDQLDIHHEDVLLKMFMYSLEGIARRWYWSLPISSISSIKYFHVVFYVYCKRIYSVDLLLEDCDEQFNIKKSLINNDQKSFTKEIHEEVFQEKEVQETFNNFQDWRLHYHVEFIVEKPCEAQHSIEENIENHTIYEDLQDNVKSMLMTIW